MNNRLLTLSLVLCLPLLFIHAFCQQVLAQEHPAVRLIQDYVKALNSDNDGEKLAFFEQNVSAEALKNRPAEARMGVMKEIRSNNGTMTIQRIITVNDSSVVALVETQRGELIDLTVFHNGAIPPKMLGLGIAEHEEPLETNLQPLTEKQLLAEVDGLIDSRVSADEFSGVVLVARHGKPIFQKAYGMADKTFSVPNRPDTKFNLGSINKRFTQIAINLLVQQGKIALSDPIGKYLPDYPNKEAATKVTVEHLLKMQGGIGDFFGENFENTPKDRIRHNNDFIPLFAEEKLHFEPGTQSEYSNGGYILLGAIIEKASGKDYYQFVEDNICRPAGMNNTAWFEADAIVPNLAQGYSTEGSPDGTRRSNIYTRPARGSAAGGGYSTAEDLLKFALACEAGKFGPAQQLGVAGGAPGLNAVLEPGLKGGFTVVVMSNYDPPSAEQVAKKIRQLVSRVSD